jgi:hypothetical protein
VRPAVPSPVRVFSGSDDESDRGLLPPYRPASMTPVHAETTAPSTARMGNTAPVRDAGPGFGLDPADCRPPGPGVGA